ncbi:hypothetical protein F4821DRAFT_226661 [Hypoxylon rubiginosum]|uniref:Uncharacterized protein n=1 Tax=Hypoxylon rubiginosum TaxID=110542 RepID=A0ACC0DGZ7_9PEZI|nr:hypothetical protein F4821DRAFT_226661 [Hypoxylon rubiginosum]
MTEIFTDQKRDAEIDKYNPQEHISSIFYMCPLDRSFYENEKPYFMNIPVHNMPGLKQTNVNYSRRRVAITDIRGHEDLFTLDKTGFAVAKFETSLKHSDFQDPHAIVSQYYDEVKRFLQENTDCCFVLPFDYQVRRKDPNQKSTSRGAPGRAQPFASIHADQTERAAMRRLEYFHPEEFARFRNYRIQIVNVWRPLRGPVYDAPLAMCDYRTVDATDRVATDIIFPDYLGETYNFWANPKHRLYFVDGQRNDEAWMIKCFDSKTDNDPSIAPFAPHVSFPYLKVDREQYTPRESIEVRTFVFYKV